ncbi:unnamed protein product [Cyprideis torosa]|uniref:Charged multivesicular body protein 7 n=1 Tax=Cyprideis torosa TaxID=163714 RepID=A0A7R8ZGV1_9CRUS|nr:unnamed protein product [Cyprideis torosa]CAG0881100.1 unnamed protein product [Cyprideis torosa]
MSSSSGKKTPKWRPAAWDDEQRMSVMMAPFRPRSLNPHAYEGRLNFWRNVIHDWCKDKRKISYTIDELREAFKRNGTPKWRPAAWDDEQRMSVMMAPFRPRSLNPHAYEGRLNFWRNVIHDWCKDKRKISYTIDELREAFKRNGVRPACLTTVVAELQREGVVKRPSEIQRAEVNPYRESWVSWGWGLAKTGASWAYSWTYGNEGSPLPQVSASEKFLNLELLDELATTIRDKELRPDMEVIVSKRNLMERHRLTESTADLILGRLWSQGVVVMKEVQDPQAQEPQHAIKFRKAQEASVSPISQEEETVFKLQSLKAQVEDNMDKMQRELESCRVEAKALLSQNSTSTPSRGKLKARQLLVKKQRLEKRLQEQEKILANIHVMEDTIGETGTTQAVVSAYAKSAQALKVALKDVSPDNIQDTLDEIADVMKDAEEIQEIIGTPIRPQMADDDAALEAELDALVAEEEERGKMEQEEKEKMEEQDRERELEERFQRLKVPEETPSPPSKVTQAPEPIPS